MGRSKSRNWGARVALLILITLTVAGAAEAEYPADCPERDQYRYFPKLPLDPRLPVVPVPPEFGKWVDRGSNLEIRVLISAPMWRGVRC